MPRTHNRFELLMVALIVALGAGMMSDQFARSRDTSRQELAVSAELKANQLAAWLHERKADAEVIRDNPLIHRLVQHFASRPNHGIRQQLHNAFAIYQRAYGYQNLLIITAEGKVLFELENPHGQPPAHLPAPETITRALRQRIPQYCDFHLGNHRLGLDFVVALPESLHSEPLLVVLQVNPMQSLFPALRATAGDSNDNIHTALLKRTPEGWRVLDENLNDTPLNIALQGEIPGSSTRRVALPQALGALTPLEDGQWWLLAHEELTTINGRAFRQSGWILIVDLLAVFAFLVGNNLLRQRRRLIEAENENQRQALALEQNEALAESNRRFEDIARASADWIWEIGADYHLTYASDSVVSVLGVPGSALQNKTLFDFMPETTRAATQAQLIERMQHGEALVDFECHFQHTDGLPRLTQTTGVPIFNPDGSLRGYRGTTRDITARREREEERGILSMAVAQSMNGIVLCNTEKRIEYVNHAFCTSTGYTANEVLGRHAGFNASGQTPAETYATLNAALARGEQWRGQFYNRHKDGSLIIFDALISPICQQDGTVSHYISIMDEVTEQVRQHQELEHHRHHLEELVTERTRQLQAAMAVAEERGRLFQEAVDSISQGFAVYDQHDRLLTCNQAYLDYYPGLQDMLVPGTAFRAITEEGAKRDIYHIESEGTQHWIEQRIAQHNRPEGHVFEQQLRDGRWLLVMESHTPSGYTVGNRIDITAQKQAELLMAEARDAADAANHAKSQFLANMSHEIRTPMNAIIGLSHLCLQTTLSPKQRDYVTKVHRAATVLLGIINDILDFSKIEAGKLHIDEVPFDLDETIHNVSTLFHAMATERGLRLAVNLSPDVPTRLRGDPLRLSQVLTNLLGNAVKFTQQGQIGVDISLVSETPEQCEIRFVVHDTGIGMTAEQQARLFQMFSQADDSITRKYGGTGLGLIISRELVNMMGGEIYLHSSPNAGSRFTFTVRCRQENQEQVSVAARSAPNILIVDDEPLMQTLLTKLVNKFGYHAHCTGSGAEALQRIDRGDTHFDLVITDWLMSGMDGLETILKVREREAYRHVPAIMITAASLADIQSLADHGIQHYLFKPVQRSQLYSVIREALADLASPPAVERHTEILRNRRVLLVEDNEFNQQVASEILIQEGMQVDIAEHGKRALELLAERPYDVVLMDMQMPVMDGITATRAIRAQARFANLPIVAMTANAQSEERERCFAIGMNDFITKPFPPESLCNVLVAQLSPAGTGNPPAAPSFAEAAPTGTTAPFDLQTGLLYTKQNHRLYWRMIGVFVKTQPDLMAELDAALQSGDTATAIRQAHTLKGMVSTLGAKPLAEAATALETALKTGAPIADTAPQHTALKDRLTEALDALEGLRIELTTAEFAPGPIDGL